MLTVVILTLNEAQHIARAIHSVRLIAKHIVVVDSGSTDDTVEIAHELGAEVLFNPWHNHATQFNWALEQLSEGNSWIMRLDADEIVTEDLARQILETLPNLKNSVAGVIIGRRISFIGRPIRHGGLFPVKVLRLFRHGRGRCENRWMDEHIKVIGEIVELSGEIRDESQKSLTSWIAKHNAYASREVVDILNLEYGFMSCETITDFRGGYQASVKRWLKENVYNLLPGGLRAFAYFFYRYIIRMGFLDGREGTAFHVLQGFWYRYLVDMKLHEVRTHMCRTSCDVITAINEVLNIDLSKRT